MLLTIKHFIQNLSLTLFLLLGNYTNESNVSEVNIGSATEAIEEFNSFLMNLLLYAGAIIVAIGIIKLIISFQQQDSHSKMQASMLLGLGAVFTATNTIITYINVKDTNTDRIVVRLVEVIGVVMKFSAYILFAYAVFQMILSLINEDSSQKVEASKLLGVSIALFSAQTVLVTITESIIGGGGIGSSVNLIIGIIAAIARFIGALLGTYALMNLIMAIKDQDSNQLQKNAIMFSVGIILMFTPAIFTAVGINMVDSSSTSSSSTTTPTQKPKPTICRHEHVLKNLDGPDICADCGASIDK